MAVAVRTLGEQIVGSCLRTGRRGVANVERGQAPPLSRTVLRRWEGGFMFKGGGPPGGLGVRGYGIPPKETGGLG